LKTLVGPGGREAHKSKGATSAHYIDIYPVANYCRQGLPPMPAASYIWGSDQSWIERQWQEHGTAATFSNDPVRTTFGSSFAPPWVASKSP
jgi:hypothetical protein